MPEQSEIGDAKKLPQPREHKAKVCIWGDLTVTDLDALCNVTSTDDRKELLANRFGLYNGDSQESAQMKDGILLDLYFYTVQFCLDNGLNKEQTSAYFSIIKRTHDICVETPFGNVNQAFKYFREMVLCHAVKRPPFSIDIFSPEQVKLLTEYAINTYFRHFKMYKYAFTPLVKLDLNFKYEGIEVPSPPPEPEPTPEPEPEPSEKVADDKPRTPEVELSDAQKELKALIQKQLDEEVAKIRTSLEDQLRVSEDGLQKKLAAAEGIGGRGSSKAGGRKKK